MYDVTIAPLPALDLAAVAHIGPYEQLGGAFDRLFAWAGSRALVGPETRFFGISWDNPDLVPPERLRSHAAMTVPAGTVLDGEAIALTLQAGRHASIVHKGSYTGLGSAHLWLIREWLPASGEEQADAPCFEEYLNDCRALPEAEWLTRISLPLRSR
jgi:AraC family transcriptional regulator